MVHRLEDGTRLLVRPIRPGDKRALQRALLSLSPESTRARFLTAKARFTRGELAYLTELDGHDHVAFVAVEADRPLRIVAVARYVRDPRHPEAAEAAITVADHLQGRGLGRRMGEILADAARAEGVERFTASMLSENRAALRLFRAISERLDAPPVRGPVREIVAELVAA